MKFKIAGKTIEVSRAAGRDLPCIAWYGDEGGTRFRIRHEGRIVDGHACPIEGGWRIWAGGESVDVLRKSAADPAAEGQGLGPVKVPFACRLVEVLVKAGEAVAVGAPLFRIESMKMEQIVTAPAAARITAVDAADGASLQRGQTVLTLAAAKEAKTDPHTEKKDGDEPKQSTGGQDPGKKDEG